MLGAFANAFRTPDLRKKMLFVLFIVAIWATFRMPEEQHQIAQAAHAVRLAARISPSAAGGK